MSVMQLIPARLATIKCCPRFGFGGCTHLSAWCTVVDYFFAFAIYR
jgi:hypothetical protein